MSSESRPSAPDERFRLIVEAAPNAIVMVDTEGRIGLVNSLTERLFGYGRDELLGRPVELLVPERSRPEHPEHRAAFLHDPQARPMGAGRDLHGLRKDGSEFPIEIGLSPVETAEGMLVLAAIADITERKLAEERFRMVVESAPNAIVAVDEDGSIVLVNSQTEVLFGHPREELLGRSVDMLVPERFRADHPKARLSFFADPRARPMGAGRDLFGLRKDGTEFPVEIGLNPMPTEQGMLVLSAIVDITQRKRAEEQLARQAHDLARSNAELQQFAYVASHDLQEPLRAVAGTVELLQRRYGGHLDARADTFIRHAVEGAARMQALIEDLLAYSRVDSEAKPLVPVSTSDVLATVCDILRTPIRESRAAIVAETMPVVRGDSLQLIQLFQNLVTNAIKFRGENAPRIEISSQKRGRDWLFTVRDNGIGIDPQYGERIFRVFQRLHTREEYSGTGIGLAICKKVVERHGGRIWVESVEGAGSAFCFTIPCYGELV